MQYPDCRNTAATYVMKGHCDRLPDKGSITKRKE